MNERLPLDWIARNQPLLVAQRKQLHAAQAATSCNYMRNRRATDPAFKLLCTMRNRLRAAIKGKVKTESTRELIGCTVLELKSHLESLFKPGMTWENHGEWEIDHIKPCALFDMTDVTQQRECFQKENLQPLWKADNRRKSAKYS